MNNQLLMQMLLGNQQPMQSPNTNNIGDIFAQRAASAALMQRPAQERVNEAAAQMGMPGHGTYQSSQGGKSGLGGQMIRAAGSSGSPGGKSG